MTACPSPITAENFQSAWKYIARKRRWAIKTAFIRQISVALAQLVYFFLFLILAMGIFYEMGNFLIREYMDRLPLVGSWWNQICGPFFSGIFGEPIRILYCIAALYLLPLVMAIVPAVLIMLLYYPRTPKQTQDPREDARQLHMLAKHAQVCAWKNNDYARKICVFFMGALMIWCFLGLMHFTYANPPIPDNVAAVAFRTNLFCFLYCLAIFLCYRIMNIPLRRLLRGLHFSHVPASMVTDAEDYYNEISKQKAAVTEEKGDA